MRNDDENERNRRKKRKIIQKIIFSISIQSYLININHNQWIKALLVVFFFCGFPSRWIVVDISISFSFALSWLTSICIRMYVYVRVRVYTHHLSCWEWNDDDNKSHVTFAYRVPQLSCFCPIISLCKILVNNLRFVTICSSRLERCMQPNVHDEGERERDSSISSVCSYLFLANIWFSLILLMFIDGELHLEFPLGIEKIKIRSLFSWWDGR